MVIVTSASADLNDLFLHALLPTYVFTIAKFYNYLKRFNLHYYNNNVVI